MRRLPILLLALLAVGVLPAAPFSVLEEPQGSERVAAPASALRARRVVAPGIPLREVDQAWVTGTLAALTTNQKIGQLLMSTQPASGAQQIADYNMGGFCFLGNGQSAAGIVTSVNALQALSPIPLWFAIDSEAGVGARVTDATVFPMIMALGAGGDANLAEEAGRVTARESQALGLQVTFGPVMDVNTEPINPIISTRSYSGLPSRVSEMAKAFVKGARAEGILTTFKHYPGHGATDGDSHSSLPTVSISRADIERWHLQPYRDLVAASSVDLIMTAHVWYSDVHPEGPWPATLSSIFNRDILRDEIGYQGILITDAFNMVGLTVAVSDTGERGVLAFENGVDVILGPNAADVPTIYSALQAAVSSGRISSSRLNASVRRVLEAKSRAGLPERTTVDPALWPTVLQHPDHEAVVRQIAERGFTLGKTRLDPVAPIATADNVLLLALTPSTTIFYRFASTTFTNEFRRLVPTTTLTTVSTNPSTTTINNIVTSSAGRDAVVVVGTDWTKINSTGQVNLIKALAARNTPVIYVGFGAPYHYSQIPEVDAFYCGYASVPAMQLVAVETLLGDHTPTGIIPVVVPGLTDILDPEGFVIK